MAVGLLDPVDNLEGLYDLTILNQVLTAAGHRRCPSCDHHHPRPRRLSGQPQQERGRGTAGGLERSQQAVRERGQRRPRSRPRLPLQVQAGEFVCLVGASGCGKTTLLNLVAGLDHPSAGEVVLSGKAALMFQESALFPWLSVGKNVELARASGRAPQGAQDPCSSCWSSSAWRARRQAAPPALRRHAPAGRAGQSAGPGGRRPSWTSRSAALDDPRRDARRAGADLAGDHSTILFVTHNVREAGRLADRIVLLTSRPGRVAAEFTSTSPGPVASKLRRLRPHLRGDGPTARGGGSPWPSLNSSSSNARNRSWPARRSRDRRRAHPSFPHGWGDAVAEAPGHRHRGRRLAARGDERWKPEFVLPSPFTVFDRLWQDMQTAEFWNAISVTMQRPSRATPWRSSSVSPSAWRSPGPVLRAAVGSLITGLQTMPSVAWFPLAILLFKLTTAIMFVIVRAAVDRQRPDPRRGPRPADHAASGTGVGSEGLLGLPPCDPAPPSCRSPPGSSRGWAFSWRSLMAGELLVIIAKSKSLGFLLASNRELVDAPGLMATMIVILVIGSSWTPSSSPRSRSASATAGASTSRSQAGLPRRPTLAVSGGGGPPGP